MFNPLLTDNNLKKFIEGLKLPDSQKNFLLDEISQMDAKERIDLLEALKDVVILNEEEKQALQKVKDNWQ
ncbi:MAG: hypothetical protein NTV36_02855 [Candidatus Staskawiczbacteria bacterium]|nr:hypothetical protein [Candidatus Staskawiczbacteria bacterium]